MVPHHQSEPDLDDTDREQRDRVSVQVSGEARRDSERDQQPGHDREGLGLRLGREGIEAAGAEPLQELGGPAAHGAVVERGHRGPHHDELGGQGRGSEEQARQGRPAPLEQQQHAAEDDPEDRHLLLEADEGEQGEQGARRATP